MSRSERSRSPTRSVGSARENAATEDCKHDVGQTCYPVRFPSGRVICSDPSCELQPGLGNLHPWKLNISFDLLPGNWHCRCVHRDSRAALLGIHHEDHRFIPSVRSDAAFGVQGFLEPTSIETLVVDSGRFGFYDAGMFHNEAACKETGYSSWEHCRESCKIENQARRAIDSAAPLGVISPSGFGDGVYELHAYMEDQKLRAAIIRFISEGASEEEGEAHYP